MSTNAAVTVTFSEPPKADPVKLLKAFQAAKAARDKRNAAKTKADAQYEAARIALLRSLGLELSSPFVFKTAGGGMSGTASCWQVT